MPSSTVFCPSLRANGSCLDPACQYGHIMHACKPCGFICSSQHALNSHLQSESHKKKHANPAPDFYKCTICDRAISSVNWQAHSRGTKHVRKCKLRGIIPEGYKPPAAQEAPGLRLCTPCDKLVAQWEWTSHLKSRKHRKLEEWAVVNTVLEKAELDKNGVSLRGDFNFDFIELTVASTGTQMQTGTISLTDGKAHVRLVSASLATSKISKQSPFTLSQVAANQTLKVGSPIVFSVALKQSYPGRAEDRLELLFKEGCSGTQFVIVRPIYAIIGSKADHDRLKPTVPYKAPSSRAREPETNIIPGIPPEFPQSLPKGNLPQAKIPTDLDAILSSNGTVGQILQQLNSSLVPAELNSQTYTRRFRHLVWIEEHRLEQDMSMYDMFEVKLTSPQKVAFRLIVPGLAEKRPSVLMGDQIVVQPHALANGPWFQGFVHTVEQNSVLIHFGGTFRKGWNKDSLYNVRFKLNRTMIRREQWALGSNFCEERVLFPTAQHLLAFGYVNATTHPVQIVNPDIGTNVRQLQAVVSIANAPKGSLPFIIFGPPGTGKTVTVVEAIRQVLKTDPTAKIFACAPSNSAADLIAQRLMDLGKEVVFRFYAPSRQKLLVPSELMNFTFLTKDGQFSAPTLDKMKTYRVVIATCGSASFATLNVGMPRGHFTHIFVDEAGQASEPEVMIAVKTLPDSKTNIILSGDPKQLGPVIRSAVARRLNMEESYLERLMKTGPYDIHANFGVTVVKLVKNFRSHNAILKFPNERFYEDELQACGNPTIINSFLNSQYLPNGKFPVVFHGVQGKDDREASSPSFFNVDEILVVTDYVKRLLAEKSKYNITEEDIGVISPYNAQSRKIRTELKRLLSPEMQVKVDSVEGFQGQERRVIIISTVRSSSEHIEYDLKHTLGFVASPRRFNVAVTRAQALLIVIGDPTVLSLDPLWRSFLNYIHNNRGWTGSPITWDPTALVDEAGGYDKQLREAATTEMKELTKRIEELTLANVEAEGDVVVDRPWRNDD